MAATTAATYPHVVVDDKGVARLASAQRVRLSLIMADHVLRGQSAQEILNRFEYLKPAELYGVFSYYYDHKEAMDQEIADHEREIERIRNLPPSDLAQKLKAWRQTRV